MHEKRQEKPGKKQPHFQYEGIENMKYGQYMLKKYLAKKLNKIKKNVIGDDKNFFIY